MNGEIKRSTKGRKRERRSVCVRDDERMTGQERQGDTELKKKIVMEQVKDKKVKRKRKRNE